MSRTRMLVLAGGISMSLLGAALLGWRLPEALHRPARARDVSNLSSQIGSLHTGQADVAAQTAALLASSNEVAASNDELTRRVGRQKSQIDSLKKKAGNLEKEISALQG